MKRKDSLAAGAKSATFAGGVGEGDIYRNLSKEARIDEVIVIEKHVEPRKKFLPNPGILLVRPIEVKTASSLLVLEEDPTKKERPSEGIVLACGLENLDGLSGHFVGTQIVYGKYSGTEFKLNGEVLLLMKFEEVLGSVAFEDESPEVEIEITPGTPVAQA